MALVVLSIVLASLSLLASSPDVRSLGGSAVRMPTSSFRISSEISISAIGLLILSVAVVVVAGLHLFLARTRAGWIMRATAQDQDAAELIGIDSRAVYARATAIAVSIAALGGVFLAIRSVFDPGSGSTQLIYAFEAVVIGGMGSLWGTLLGGILLGVSQTIGAQLNPQYAALACHLVFLAVLVARFGGVLPRLRGFR